MHFISVKIRFCCCLGKGIMFKLFWEKLMTESHDFVNVSLLWFIGMPTISCIQLRYLLQILFCKSRALKYGFLFSGSSMKSKSVLIRQRVLIYILKVVIGASCLYSHKKKNEWGFFWPGYQISGLKRRWPTFFGNLTCRVQLWVQKQVTTG